MEREMTKSVNNREFLKDKIINGLYQRVNKEYKRACINYLQEKNSINETLFLSYSLNTANLFGLIGEFNSAQVITQYLLDTINPHCEEYGAIKNVLASYKLRELIQRKDTEGLTTDILNELQTIKSPIFNSSTVESLGERALLLFSIGKIQEAKEQLIQLSRAQSETALYQEVFKNRGLRTSSTGQAYMHLVESMALELVKVPRKSVVR